MAMSVRLPIRYPRSERDYSRMRKECDSVGKLRSPRIVPDSWVHEKACMAHGVLWSSYPRSVCLFNYAIDGGYFNGRYYEHQ
jgi:hypothetical protein